ncbi:lambda family phage portal protein [Agrobacterium vitis]|nr:lambda family phage portal protein [Agrobacterium vitis]
MVSALLRAVAPRFALKREIARQQLDQLSRQKKRRDGFDPRAGYDGATRGHRTAGRLIGSTSADREIWTSLSRLRDVHREQVRNNPYAGRAVQVIASNVVGGGVTMAVKHKTKNRQAVLEDLLKRHMLTTKIDFAGRHNLYGLQNLVVRTVVESGECLVVRRRAKASRKLPLAFQVEVLEPDYLVSYANEGVGVANVAAGNTVIQGIEYDADGQRVAYHLYKHHPGSLYRLFGAGTVRVPAEDVIHVYRQDRPGQSRGVPWGAPVIMTLWDLADYEDAELMRQKIAACFAVFWIDSNGTLKLGSDGKPEAPEYNADMLEPGMQQRLPPGTDVKFSTPPTTAGYPDYLRSMIRKIAIGYGVPYEALAGDLSQVNFSSGRMGWLEFQRTITHWQSQMLIPHFCERVAEWFLDAADLVSPGISGGASVSHTEPRREMIDPAKEIPGIRDAIRAGLMSRSSALREMGENPEEVDAEMAADNERADRLGLIYDSDGRKPMNGGQPAPANDDTPPDKQKDSSNAGKNKPDNG